MSKTIRVVSACAIVLFMTSCSAQTELLRSAKGLASLISSGFSASEYSGTDVDALSSPDPNFGVNNNGKAAQTRELTVVVAVSEHAARLEPASGRLAGVNLGENAIFTSNNVIDIAAFETTIGASPAIYALDMRVGDDLPINFVLRCIALDKIPHITIYPPESGSPWDFSLLESTVDSFAAIQAPMFVRLYPYAIGRGFSPDEYKKFFRRARKLFEDKCPQTAIIWGTSAESIENSAYYFPGASYVDWIGLEIYGKLLENSEIDRYLKLFSETYGKIAPLIISECGFSHYTNADNQYRNDIAIAETEAFYATIMHNYSKIKAIIYFDKDMTKSEIGQDFTISTSPDLAGIFAACISTDDFCPRLETAEFVKNTYISSHSGILYDGCLYINEKTITAEFDLIAQNSLKSPTKIIAGQKFDALDALELSLNLDINVDIQDNLIFIQKR